MNVNIGISDSDTITVKEGTGVTSRNLTIQRITPIINIGMIGIKGEKGDDGAGGTIATGAELDIGTDNTKSASAKALKDSHNVPSVAPSTLGNVLTSDGTDWISSAPVAGAGDMLLGTEQTITAAKTFNAGTLKVGEDVAVTSTSSEINLLSGKTSVMEYFAIHANGYSLVASDYSGMRTQLGLDDSITNLIISANGKSFVASDYAGMKTQLGLGTAAYTATGCYATSSQGTLADNAFAKSSVVTCTSPIQINSSASSTVGNGFTLSAASASSVATGFLTMTDWNTFNGKAPSDAHYFTDQSEGGLSNEVVVTANGKSIVTTTYEGIKSYLDLSGTNTGDNAINSQYSGLASSKMDTFTLSANGQSFVASDYAGMKVQLSLGTAAYTASGSYATSDQGTLATNAVPQARTITTTSPLTIDGGASANLSGNRTLSAAAASASVTGWATPAQITKLDNIEAGATAFTSAMARTAVVSDATYNATTWDNVTDYAPSMNVLRDKIESMGGGSGDTIAPSTNSADYVPQWNGTPNSKTLIDGFPISANGKSLVATTYANMKILLDITAGGSDDVARDNIIILAWQFAIHSGISIFNLEDGVTDEFEDETGVNTVASTATYNSSDDYYSAAQTLQYPPAHSDTYVKATTTVGANYSYNATNPAKSLTGGGTNAGTAWLSASPFSNQRFHIDLGQSRVIKKIYYENFHNAGTATNQGVRHFTVQGSDNAAAFAELTYATNTNWTDITADVEEFDIHKSEDAVDPKYVNLTNTTAYRYWAIKFADDWGGGTYGGLRRIVLMTNDTLSLISNSKEAITEPTTARLLALIEPIGTPTINTDIKGWISNDNGSNYDQVTLSYEGLFDSTKKIYAGNVTLTDRNDQTMVQKITAPDTLGHKIHAWAMMWK